MTAPKLTEVEALAAAVQRVNIMRRVPDYASAVSTLCAAEETLRRLERQVATARAYARCVAEEDASRADVIAGAMDLLGVLGER